MEAFGWYKETLIFLKGNKVFLLVVTAALGIGGNLYQAMPKAEVKIVEVPVAVVEKSACGCMGEINKLKRWHE